MPALLLYGSFVLHLGLMVYCLADMVRTDEERVRAFPKSLWVVIVIFVPLAGSIVWLTAAKEPLPPSSFGPRPGAVRRPIAPDDDPAFLGKLDREREQEERIRALEEQLKKRDDDPETEGGKAGSRD